MTNYECVYLEMNGDKDRFGKTREIDPGNVYADYDVNGKLIGIEVLGRFKMKEITDPSLTVNAFKDSARKRTK